MNEKAFKIITWLGIIPICYAVYVSLWKWMLYAGYEMDKIDPSSTGNAYPVYMILLPIFYISICNIIVHLIAGGLSLKKLEIMKLSFLNLVFHRRDSMWMKILKLIGYALSIFYFSLIVESIVRKDMYEGLFGIFTIIVTIFYIIWFSAIDQSSYNKRKDEFH